MKGELKWFGLQVHMGGPVCDHLESIVGFNFEVLNRKKRCKFNLSMPMALRSASKLLSASDSILSNSVKRGFHSTGVKRMGGHGHDEPYYLHAKHMYNLDRMKHQKLKMSLSVLAAFSIGVAVPVYAVIFQQKKTASG